MNNSSLGTHRRSFLLALMTVPAVLSFSSTAFAFGTVRFKQTRIEETNEKWKLELDVDYGSTPHMGHIPFDFVFELKTYYEYSVQDGDKEPLIRPKPQREQKPQHLPVDIDFSDASSKVWQRTKFSISIRRKDDFEAGEYRLTIRRVSDGAQLGQPVTLIFNGQNPLVDRRTMVMPEAGRKKRDADAGASGGGEDGGAPAEKAAEAEPKAADEPIADTTADTEKQPQTVDKRPGGHGCGCQVPGSAAPFGLAAAGLAAASIIALGARRRSS